MSAQSELPVPGVLDDPSPELLQALGLPPGSPAGEVDRRLTEIEQAGYALSDRRVYIGPFVPLRRDRPIPLLRTGFHKVWGEGLQVTGESLDWLARQFTGSVPIDRSHNFEEAAGWIHSVHRDGDVLWAQVQWTPRGAQEIRDKEWAYLSPELGRVALPGGELSWVLVGAGLTNRPGIPGLIVTHSPIGTAQTREVVE